MATRPRHGPPRLVAALIFTPLLAIGLAGCGDKTEELSASQQQGATSTTAAPPKPTSGPTDENDEAPEASADPAPLAHDEVLEAGLAGNAPIACVYNFDEEEMDQQRMFSMTGWSTAVADIYLNGASVYWEITQEDNRTSHVLGTGKTTYAWKTPGDAAGAKGDTSSGSEQAKLAALMETHASDCTLYTGPLSIFEVPDDIEFEYFPG